MRNSLKIRHCLQDFITDTAEFIKHLILRASKSIRIIKADVQTLPHFSGKDRTFFPCAPAYGNDIIPLLVKILRHVFRVMSADIYPDLSHHLYRERMHL